MAHFVQSSVLAAFPALLVLGAAQDLLSYRISNAISLALAAAFPLAAWAALAAGAPLSAIGLDLATGAAGLALGVLLFALRWVGGGDAKLFAAAALWLGWPAVLAFIEIMAFSGGALALLLITLRSPRMRPLALAGPGWVARLAEPTEGAPYGVVIAAGAIAAFPLSAIARAVWGG